MVFSKNFLAKAATLQKSLLTLNRSIKKSSIVLDTLGSDEYDEFVCLALVQSLEMCVESLWKFLRIMLQEQHGVEVVSLPKGIINQALTIGLITAAEFNELMVMIDNRNLMAHTYDQAQAHAVVVQIPTYAALLEKITIRLVRT